MTIRITQNTLDHYYEINKLHLQWSFWTSLGALVVGLLALIVGVGLTLSGITSVPATLATAGGVLTQFIGIGFFYLYSKNLRQSNTFSSAW
jgi:drug/metabolite transporter (DMT)-like permease